MNRTPGLTFIFFTILLDVIGFGLLIPVAPKLVAEVQGLAFDGNEGVTAGPYGWLIATYGAMQFIFSPVLGSLSDRVGRRPVILISLLGSGLDYFAQALAPSLTFLFITRALNGISGANISACGAYIADVTPPEKRAAGYGILGAAFGLGFIIGPLLGGVLASVGGLRAPFYAAGVLTLANAAYGWLVVPESLPRERRRAFSWKKANPIGALVWLGTHRVVATLTATLFIVSVAQFGLHATWVLSMHARFAWSDMQVGLSLFLVGLTAAIVQGGLARRIIPLLGERFCLLGGLIIGVGAFLGYALATESWMVYAVIVAASLGGVSQPALQAIMSKAISPTEQGLLQGATGGLQSIAGVAGPLLGTAVFQASTVAGITPGTAAAREGASSPFFVGAVLAGVSLVPVVFIWTRMPRTVAQSPDETPHPAAKP